MNPKEIFCNEVIISVMKENDSNPISIKELELLLLEQREYVIEYGIKNFSIAFDGYDFIHEGIEHLKSVLGLIRFPLHTNIQLYIYTNGAILTKDWALSFKEYNILIKIFNESYLKVSNNLDVIRNSQVKVLTKGIGILNVPGLEVNYELISVIDYRADPSIIYNFIKRHAIKRLEFVLPEANHNSYPVYKTVGHHPAPYGKWLAEFFELWYKDNDKPFIRIFNQLINLTFDQGVVSQTFGNSYNRRIYLDRNGYSGIRTSLNNSGAVPTLNAVYGNDYNYQNFHAKKKLCSVCSHCLIKKNCGGGAFSTRFSMDRNYDNPSVYCLDLLKIILYIFNKLIAELPNNKRDQLDLDFLSIEEAMRAIDDIRIKNTSKYIKL